MTAIACVGEERRAPLEQVVDELDRQLRLLAPSDLTRLVIAYEPAWAIGIGAHAAPAEWVGQVHSAIRARLAEWGPVAGSIPILYGGSVDTTGAGALLAQPGVDGLFVGRQALDPRVFAAIAHTPI
jgi:triosephosphate isomerase